jgi:hypothetical protein
MLGSYERVARTTETCQYRTFCARITHFDRTKPHHHRAIERFEFRHRDSEAQRTATTLTTDNTDSTDVTATTNENGGSSSLPLAVAKKRFCRYIRVYPCSSVANTVGRWIILVTETHFGPLTWCRQEGNAIFVTFLVFCAY